LNRSTKKTFKFFLILPLLGLLLTVTKSSVQAYDLEKHMGLYQVVEAKCEATKGSFNICPEIKFIELVKGKFYDIGPDDLAFVLWRIETDDTKALYEASLVKNHKNLVLRDNKVWFVTHDNKNEQSQEYFELKDGEIGGYHFLFTRKNKAGQSFFRNFYYRLEATTRNEIATYKLLYPDNSDPTVKAMPSLDTDRYTYKNSKDSITKRVVIDKNLDSKFFNTHTASYKWFVVKNDDGTFENTIGNTLTDEDKRPVEHTANCVSTHQGEHVMNFCDATLRSDVLRLKIHGGLPAYSSSLLVEINKNSEFSCFFQAVYPAPVTDLRWNVLSKKMKLKALDFKKGKPLYAWLSVDFEEISTYKGEKTVRSYKIEGFIKPMVK
jgi:hypothetical protein